MGVKNTKIRSFAWKHYGESGMRLFFYLYHTNEHPGKLESPNLHGSKIRLQTKTIEISLGT